MNDIKEGTAQPVTREEPRHALEPGSEDGFSLTRRSVLTEPLLPARCVPMPRRKSRRPRPTVTLPF